MAETPTQGKRSILLEFLLGEATPSFLPLALPLGPSWDPTQPRSLQKQLLCSQRTDEEQAGFMPRCVCATGRMGWEMHIRSLL